MNGDTPDLSEHPVVFGDDDPEDAWCASDPLSEKVDILFRWVASVEDNVASGDYSHDRELFRKLSAREEINRLTRARSTPSDTRELLSLLDERLDDVEP